MESMDRFKLDIALPPLPSTVARVGELISSRETDIDTLIDIVKHDPSVSVDLLRRVNSAYYSITREVESIDQAVRLLGFVDVSSPILIEGMNGVRNRFADHPQLFRHILQAAVFSGRFAQLLAEELDLPRPWLRVAFSTGLVLGTVRLVLLHARPDRYADLVQTTPGPLPAPHEEQRAFGDSHASIAPRACARWGLPERIGSVLYAAQRRMRTAASAKMRLATVVRISEELARQNAGGFQFDPPEDLRALACVTAGDVRAAARSAATYADDVGSA